MFSRKVLKNITMAPVGKYRFQRSFCAKNQNSCITRNHPNEIKAHDEGIDALGDAIYSDGHYASVEMLLNRGFALLASNPSLSSCEAYQCFFDAHREDIDSEYKEYIECGLRQTKDNFSIESQEDVCVHAFYVSRK